MLRKFILALLIVANVCLGTIACQAKTSSAYSKTTEAGLSLLQRGRLTAARTRLTQALDLVDADRIQHPAALDNLGLVYEHLGLYDRAQILYELALKERQDRFGKIHSEVAISLDHLGRLFIARGRYSDAERSLTQALALREKMKSDKYSGTLASLAQLRLYQGNLRDATNLCRLSLKSQSDSPDYVTLANTRRTMALINLTKSQYAAAEEEVGYAQAIVEKHVSKSPILLADNLDILARIYLCQGKAMTAETVASEAWSMRKKIFGRKHPLVATSLITCGNVYLKLDNYKSASDCFTESLDIATVTVGINHPIAGLAEFGLAFCDLAQNQAKESQKHFKEGMRIFEIVGERDSPVLTFYQKLYVARLWSRAYVVEAVACVASRFTNLLSINPALDANAKVFERAVSEDSKEEKPFFQANVLFTIIGYILLFLGSVACFLCIPILVPALFSPKDEVYRLPQPRTPVSSNKGSVRSDLCEREPVQSGLRSSLRPQRNHIPDWRKRSDEESK